MDDFTKELLRNWGLQDLIQTFADNEITEKSLQNLNDDLIKELIPKIGVRIIFVEKWKEAYKNNVVLKETSHSQERIETYSKSSCETTNSTDSDIEKDDFPRQNTFIGDFNINKENKVHSILNKSLKGRAILKSYKTKKVLTSKNRNVIVDLIIPEILKTSNSKLSSTDLSNVSDSIVEIFPNEEKEVYFVPAIKKKCSGFKKSIPCRGKLVNKYRNCLHQFKMLTNVDDSTKDVVTEVEDLADEHKSKEWLKRNLAPWNMVEFNWECSYMLRRNEFLHDDATIEKMIEDWPILKHPHAYKLIKFDFNKLQITDSFLSLTAWKTFVSLLQLIRSMDKKDTETQQLNNLLKFNNLNDDSMVIITLFLLPHVLPPRGRVRCAKKNWKPSIDECRKSIINHVTIAGDINLLIEKRRDAMKEYKIPLQPSIIVLGSTLTKVEKIYITLDDILYEVSSALDAVNICFQLFFVLNIKYPPESQHIWELIQYYFFQIKTKFDKYIPFVTELMNDMKNISE
ncbi:uncharacterized protein [Prorops nasuta]|uniref:uncharacterized protein n=1 Tax=Prorops nasuta TaxID=863751 RepID=UPI0034CDC340